jgi:23S rRNA pseudouridine2605 synthase
VARGPRRRAPADPARSAGGRRAGGDRSGRAAPRRSGIDALDAPIPGAPDAGGEEGDQGRVRLNKVLSAAGLGSRRAVEELVRAGRVSIGGRVVTDLGRRVDPERDEVAVDGSRVVVDQRRRYWLLNKPAGVVTTAADPQGRPTVVEMVPARPRVFPVGRLDRDTEGLLLLTNDGDLAYRLTHARFGVEKRYLAEVEQLPRDALARLRRGVVLEDGPARAERARAVGSAGRRRMVEVVMVEGRNREVRRLLDAVGAPVRRLVRTGVGPLRLTGLAPGEYRALEHDEVRGLYRAVGL